MKRNNVNQETMHLEVLSRELIGIDKHTGSYRNRAKMFIMMVRISGLLLMISM